MSTITDKLFTNVEQVVEYYRKACIACGDFLYLAYHLKHPIALTECPETTLGMMNGDTSCYVRLISGLEKNVIFKDDLEGYIKWIKPFANAGHANAINSYGNAMCQHVCKTKNQDDFLIAIECTTRTLNNDSLEPEHSNTIHRFVNAHRAMTECSILQSCEFLVKRITSPIGYTSLVIHVIDYCRHTKNFDYDIFMGCFPNDPAYKQVFSKISEYIKRSGYRVKNFGFINEIMKNVGMQCTRTYRNTFCKPKT